MTLSKKERMEEFFARLRAAPAASSHDQARTLVDAILNAVEDEFSGVPNNPQAYRTDGRLYPVQDDNVDVVDGHPTVRSYHSRRHTTFIAKNGAVEIHDEADGSIVLVKPGADGQGVWS